ncbi:MAG: SemiSWEET transporter [Xanthobacteraceae bacterium]
MVQPAAQSAINALMTLRFVRDDAMTLRARKDQTEFRARQKKRFAVLWFHFCHTKAAEILDRFETAISMTFTAMPSGLVEAIGAAGAVLTTLCWVPQAAKIIRERDTRAISLPGTALCVIGVLLWLVYGLAIVDAPLIVSSIVTFAMTFIILVLKIRHG